MNNITIYKIDLACEQPAKSAEFYSKIFNIEFEKIIINKMDHYLGRLNDFQLFLCPKELANVSDSNSGVHQIHISINTSLNSFISTLAKFDIHYQNVNFNPKKEQICVRDLDNNPCIISGK